MTVDALFPALLDPPAGRPALAFPDGGADLPRAGRRRRCARPRIAGPDRVAVWATPTLPTAVGVVAALLAGVPAVPVNPRSGERELAHVVADAAPGAVLAEPDVELPAPLGRAPPDRRPARVGTRRATARRARPPDAPALVIYTSGHHRAAEGRGAVRAARSPRTSTRSPTPGRGRRPTCSSMPCRCSTCTGWCSACSARCAAAARCAISGRSPRRRSPRRSTPARRCVFGVPTQYHRLADELETDPAAAAAVGRARLLVSGSAALTAVDHARLHAATGLAVRRAVRHDRDADHHRRPRRRRAASPARSGARWRGSRCGWSTTTARRATTAGRGRGARPGAVQRLSQPAGSDRGRRRRADGWFRPATSAAGRRRERSRSSAARPPT